MTLSRRELRKQEVRGRITDAAIELFSQAGCEASTVEEICERAEVARKTFYNYYPSKQHLIRELSDSLLFDETQNLIELALERFDTTRERIDFIWEHMVGNLSQFEALERSLILQTLMDVSSEAADTGEKLRMLNAAYARLVQRGVETGELSDNIDSAFVGEMIVGTMNTVLINWIHDPEFPVLIRLEQVRPLIMNLLELDSRDVSAAAAK